MPDWVVERGIGETRFARIENGEIVEARVLLDGIVPAATELTGRLERSGMQLFVTINGQQYLLPNGAPGVSDGGQLRAEVVRERIPGAEPWKRPLARLAQGEPAPALPAARELPLNVRNELDDAGWDDLIEEAGSGVVRFGNGELRITPTPAMTLIDVDGTGDLFKLAISAARASARAILRLQIGGSIGIDFPTLAGKQQRSSVAGEVARSLPPPFEHTAMNGFGFMQIVRPRRRASLLELAEEQAPFHARALLRRVGKGRAGSSRLVAHPAVVAVLERQTDWIEALGRQIGGSVTLRSEPSLPIHAGYAENI